MLECLVDGEHRCLCLACAQHAACPNRGATPPAVSGIPVSLEDALEVTQEAFQKDFFEIFETHLRGTL